MQKTKTGQGPTSSLRYYGTAAAIAVSYLGLLITPWVLTCILHYRPIAAGRPFYEGLPWKAFSSRYPALDTTKGPQFLFAIQALNAVSTLVSIPVILALLARAAVVYSQRRTPKQTLSARQLFTLADGRWLTGGYTPLSIYAVSLLAVALSLPLVRSLLISTETIAVASPTSGNWMGLPGYLLAYDVDPAELSMVGQYDAVGKTRARLLSTSFIQAEPHVWGFEHHSLTVQNVRGVIQPGRYFVSKMPMGTNTGMIRAHALRLNSSAPVCTDIPEQDFPSPCPGPKPFVTSMATEGLSVDLSINICVPGNQSASPWSVSWDRQEITEQLYVQVRHPRSSPTSALYNTTMVCTVNTTRGFFELPNFHNDFTPGPLVDSIPSNGELMAPLDSWWYELPAQDLEPLRRTNKAEIWETSEEVSSGTLIAPGPLSISAQALFGPGSFFHEARRLSIDSNATWWNAYRTMCTGTGIPFFEEWSLMYRGSCSGAGADGEFLDERRAAEEVRRLLRASFNQLLAGSPTEIDTAVSFANEAVLTIWPGSSLAPSLVRPIYYNPKAETVKPRITGGIAGIAVVSVLLGLQVLGIILLTLYVYSSPTWTETLDSLAIIRIAHQLGGDAEPISKMPLRPVGGEKDKEVLEQLGTVSALVGVADHPKEVRDVEAASSTGSGRAISQQPQNRSLESETDTGYTPVLRVGAPGVVTRRKAGGTTK